MADSGIVLVFLLLGSGGALHPSSAQDCGPADVLVNNGDVVTLFDEVVYCRNIADEAVYCNNMSTIVFVQPGRDFEGISVGMRFGQDIAVAWFPNEQQCHPDDAKWVPVEVEVVLVENKVWLSSSYHLDYTLKIGGCTKKCKRDWNHDVMGNLKVVAHGSSSWKCRSPPPTCFAVMSPLLTTPASCTSQDSQDIRTANPLSRPVPCSATTTPSTTITTIPTSTSTVVTTSTASPIINPASPSIAPTKSTSSVTTTPTTVVTPSPTFISTTTTTATPSSSPGVSTDVAPMSLPSTVVVTMAKVAMVVETMVIVLVVVFLVPPMRQTMLLRQLSDPNPLSRNSEHVSMNSLYEPFSGCSQHRHHENSGVIPAYQTTSV